MSTEAPHANVSDFEHRVEHVLMQRMDRLERENRRLKRYSAMMIVFCAILLGLSAAMVFFSGRFSLPGAGQVVAARQFVLQGDGGKTRGVWGVEKDGAVRLSITDGQGKARLRVSLLQDGSPGISLLDSAERRMAVLGVDQTASLALADRTGTPRTILGVNGDGSSSLLFADRTGATRSSIGVDNRGVGSFTLVDRSGREIGTGEPEPAPAVDEPAAVDSQPPEPRPAPRRR